MLGYLYRVARDYDSDDEAAIEAELPPAEHRISDGATAADLAAAEARADSEVSVVAAAEAAGAAVAGPQVAGAADDDDDDAAAASVLVNDDDPASSSGAHERKSRKGPGRAGVAVVSEKMLGKIAAAKAAPASGLATAGKRGSSHAKEQQQAPVKGSGSWFGSLVRWFTGPATKPATAGSPQQQPNASSSPARRQLFIQTHADSDGEADYERAAARRVSAAAAARASVAASDAVEAARSHVQVWEAALQTSARPSMAAVALDSHHTAPRTEADAAATTTDSELINALRSPAASAAGAFTVAQLSEYAARHGVATPSRRKADLVAACREHAALHTHNASPSAAAMPPPSASPPPRGAPGAIYSIPPSIALMPVPTAFAAPRTASGPRFVVPKDPTVEQPLPNWPIASMRAYANAHGVDLTNFLLREDIFRAVQDDWFARTGTDAATPHPK